jgi:hypothetical protein
MLDDGGIADVLVKSGEGISLSPKTKRAIAVPFVVSTPLGVTIASVVSSRIVDISPGSYLLVFETYEKDSGTMAVHLSFVVDPSPEPRILLADDELRPTYPLTMDAKPAV